MHFKERLPHFLSRLHIDALNPMQEEALMMIPKEPETLLLAPTGSGKTLAYLLAVLSKLDDTEKEVQCLILSPSRELTIQIEEVWKSLSTGFKVNSCYGGHDAAIEKKNLRVPPAVLIGTPGRICDHIVRKSFDLSKIQTIVYDEFDKSLALGFHEQMQFISANLLNISRKILVSATAKIQIPDFVGLIHPVVLNHLKQEEEGRLQLYSVMSPRKDKLDTLFDLLCNLGSAPTIVFCNHRESTERCSALLHERGMDNAFFHGGMEQIDREKTLIKFRNGTVCFLIASDLAARGLDITNVQHIIHYHLPMKSEEFVHRNGRTARMTATGNAFIILNQEEKLPTFIDTIPEAFQVISNAALPAESLWATIYVSGGKKDKISKGDIMGFLAKVGNLIKEDIGRIDILDFMSFVAVKKIRLDSLFLNIAEQKLKGKKYKIELVL